MEITALLNSRPVVTTIRKQVKSMDAGLLADVALAGIKKGVVTGVPVEDTVYYLRPSINAKDGSVKFTNKGDVALVVAPSIQKLGTDIHNNMVSELESFVSSTWKEDEKGMTELKTKASKLAEPLVKADSVKVVAAAQKRAQEIAAAERAQAEKEAAEAKAAAVAAAAAAKAERAAIAKLKEEAYKAGFEAAKASKELVAAK